MTQQQQQGKAQEDHSATQPRSRWGEVLGLLWATHAGHIHSKDNKSSCNNVQVVFRRLDGADTSAGQLNVWPMRFFSLPCAVNTMTRTTAHIKASTLLMKLSEQEEEDKTLQTKQKHLQKYWVRWRWRRSAGCSRKCAARTERQRCRHAVCDLQLAAATFFCKLFHYGSRGRGVWGVWWDWTGTCGRTEVWWSIFDYLLNIRVNPGTPTSRYLSAYLHKPQ